MCDFVIITNYREWFRASDQLITLFLGLSPILWLQKWSWFDIKQNAFDPVISAINRFPYLISQGWFGFSYQIIKRVIYSVNDLKTGKMNCKIALGRNWSFQSASGEQHNFLLLGEGCYGKIVCCSELSNEPAVECEVDCSFLRRH